MQHSPEQLAAELNRLDQLMIETEQRFSKELERIHPGHRRNAANLLHYLLLRSIDFRNAQDDLHAWGLSSLASAESHIRGQLHQILYWLQHRPEVSMDLFHADTAHLSLTRRAATLFGTKQYETVPFIMVTLESSLAENYEEVKNLLQSGMNVARINCAHDDEATWLSMIQHIRRATHITGLTCKIFMDLPGPKIRTVIRGSGRKEIKTGDSFHLIDPDLFDIHPHAVGCSLSGIVDQLQVGDTVLFDDGLIETRVDKRSPGMAKLLVQRISTKKPLLKAEKGINFPDTILDIPALTDQDRVCMPFIVQYADMIGYSFVRTTDDVDCIREALGTAPHPALVLKIETPEAVRNLPDLLLSAMQEEHIGLMIARGDLAVEIGFERLSEIQEEILWLCEAAHVPVIWATQVLESLNKSGLATRSEVTDAAHATSADCVMINKGMHMIKTIETLRDILLRSGGHHIKKRYTFRPLSIAKQFIDSR